MPGGVEPGDVICIKAGVRGRLKLIGFKGTKEQPLTFKNCGGQVIFDNTSMDGTFVFDQSRYVRITGTGSPSHKYGFYIRTASHGSAMYVTESDIEVDHIEIGDAGFAGIMSKVEAKCDNKPYHRGNFTMYNMSFHDLYIHDTEGEGLYIGSSYYTGKDYGCGMVYSHEIHGLRVYNNIVENTGADGIQVGCATKDVEVYNNKISNYGHDPFASSQDMGLILNPGTTGKFYNNDIRDGRGMGIMVLGIGDIYLYNNLVVRSGGDGIFIDERSPLIPNSGYHVFNNTVVNPGRDGIRMYSKKSVGSRFFNNIVTEPKTLSLNYYSKNQYLYIISTEVKYTAGNNLFVPRTADAKFINPTGGNYQLQETSAAVNKGLSLGSQVPFDLLRTPRPQGGAFDIGAYEYSGNTRTSNTLPVVNAGNDKTITLPSSSLSLSGSASDADGSIASLSWTKVSGPSASMSGTSSASLSLSSLVEGVYTFRLTATDNTGASAYDDVLVTVKAESTTTSPTTTTNSSGLAAPSNLSGYADRTTAIKLNWKNNNGSSASEHEIHMSVGKNTSYYLRAKAGSTGTAYTVTNLSPGQTYYFKVRAKGSKGYSEFSNEIVFKMEEGAVATSTSAEAAPADADAPSVNAGSDQSITLPSNSVTLRGSASAADGSTPSVSWTKVSGPSASMTGSTNLSMSASNLTEGSYVFRLTATDSKGTSAADDVKVTVTAEASTSTSPSGLNAPSSVRGYADKSTVVKLSWRDNSSTETEQEIYMSAGGNSNYQMRAKAGSNQTAYTITNLSSGQTYYFRIRSKNDNGYSEYSEEVMIKMVEGNVTQSVSSDASASTSETSAPADDSASSSPADSYAIATPSHLGGYADRTSAIKLDWKDNSNNESEFEIYMSEGSTSNYQLRAKAGANQTAYTVTRLTAGQTYYFRVRAKNSDGYSDYSNEIVFKMVSDAIATTISSANLNDSDVFNYYSGTSETVAATGQEDIQPEAFTAYPNPATDHINLRYEHVAAYSKLQVQVVDYSGAVRLSVTETATATSGEIRLDLNAHQLTPGYYVIKVTSSKGEENIRFLKN